MGLRAGVPGVVLVPLRAGAPVTPSESGYPESHPALGREVGADVVVSTYPVATQVLGDMRRRARARWRWPWGRRSGLAVPAVNFVTDFGYHPFWAHKGIDLNLAVHPKTVAAVATRTLRPSVTCAPLVDPRFAAAGQRRDFERARLGLGSGELAALISSGSWGIGTVRETLELVAAEPGLVPVVVCGHNDHLRQELERLVEARGYRAVILGWTDDMPGLMAACDVLVENAGGLTSLEAMSAGLPLVSFRPIPGHGRKSAAAMSAAGVSCLARGAAQLVGCLEHLGRPGPARDAQLRAAASLFAADAATTIVQVATWGIPPARPLRPVARVARAASSAALVAAMSWVGLTTGVGVAAAAGAGVAHPPPGQPDTVYLGVRLDEEELSNPQVRETLFRLDASAVIELKAAEVEPGAVRDLATLGIDLESGGLGFRPGTVGAPLAPWTVALSDSQSVQVLSVIAARPVQALVPNRSLSAFDLVDASAGHVKMIVPNTTLPAAPSGAFPREQLAVPQLQADQIYVVNGALVSGTQLDILLDNVHSELASEHLTLAPLSGLR